MSLEKSEADTVLNFLREKIEADDLPQIEEILARNTVVETAVDEPEPFPGRPRPGGTMDPPPANAMDSRRRFEKENGIASRPIRVLG